MSILNHDAILVMSLQRHELEPEGSPDADL